MSYSDVSCRAMDVGSSSAQEMPPESDVKAPVKTVDLLPISTGKCLSV